MEWLEPWNEVTSDALLASEVTREVPANHILFGVRLKAIARRIDCDDVLFEILDGSSRVAVVHLTYARETDPQWPLTEIFRDREHFATTRMASDHETFDV